MAEGEDVQPLVCDNGTGMVKVQLHLHHILQSIGAYDPTLLIEMKLVLLCSELICRKKNM